MQLSPKKKVLLFVAIVFPLTWLIDLVNWLLGGTDNLIMFTVLMVVAMFVPAVVAAIIMQWVTKEKLRDAGVKWGKKRYILKAYLLMLAIALVTYGLTLVVGWGRIDSDASTLKEFLDTLGVTADIPSSVLLGVVGFTALFTGVIVNTTYAFGEEFGWRGFLLPNLLHLGKLKACLISGVIWGVWHTPLILMGHLYEGYPVLGVLMITIMCVFLGIIFGWLRIASGSLIPAIVAHAALNAQMLAYFPSFLVTDVDPVLGGGTGIIGLGVMGVVALWLVVTRRVR
ncbi:MAG TPA: CPBP family intramembrane metalloprotease [Dehalococcoidia bacterium]|nr:CPBP family intramembrane metalloprotease [Dehalococcoidia bacterium]